MYWVFNDQQAEAAIAEYVENNTETQDDPVAMYNLLVHFLQSDEFKQRDMVRNAD